MSLRITLLILGAFAFVTCEVAPTETTANQYYDSMTFRGSLGEPCFEVQVEVWFTRFHQLQQKGFDMYSADTEARKSSAEAYLNCRNSHDGKLAVQARKN